MMQNREVPQYVEAEFHRGVKYFQQWQSKRVSVNDDINLDELDNEELADHIHWEHSRHLSAQKGAQLDSHVGNMRIKHDWTTKFFDGACSPDRMPPKL